MRNAIRGLLTALALILTCGAAAEAEIILVTPALNANGQDVWCMATNFAAKPQFITAQIIRNGVLLLSNADTCNDGPVAPGLSCFAQVFDPGGGATLCLFVVKTRKVLATAQLIRVGPDGSEITAVVPAVKRP
jgi:hypothetical protein